jgi:hypothetical protein
MIHYERGKDSKNQKPATIYDFWKVQKESDSDKLARRLREEAYNKLVHENAIDVPQNSSGGRRQPQKARFDLIPYEALKAMADAFGPGEARYGRLDRDLTLANWKGLDITGEQSPISHSLKHIALYAAGETTDPETGAPEDHLGHALANLAMMAWFAASPDSEFAGLTYPEMLAAGYRKKQGGVGDVAEDVRSRGADTGARSVSTDRGRIAACTGPGCEHCSRAFKEFDRSQERP